MAQKINKIALLLIKLVISSGLLYFVLSKTGVEKVLAIIKTVNPAAFFAVIAIYIFSTYLSTLRWRLLLPDEFKNRRLFSYYMIGSFFNTFLPGIVGGDAVKSYYLYKDTNKGSLSFASVFMDRYIGFVSLMIMGIIAFLIGIRFVRGTVIEWLLPSIVTLFLLASFIIFGLRVGKRLRLLSEFYEYFYTYKSQKSVIIKTLLFSFAIQILSAMSMYIISLGLGQQISPLYFFIFFPIITTIATLPISISGLGVREGAFVLLFGLLGVKPEMATAMSFAWFLSFSFAGLIGLFEYVRLKK